MMIPCSECSFLRAKTGFFELQDHVYDEHPTECERIDLPAENSEQQVSNFFLSNFLES